MKTRIDYGYANFNFDWTWIKDKQMIVKGNHYFGQLIILDANGETVGWYGYELISDNYKDRNDLL
jgi:hypothetical protein